MSEGVEGAFCEDGASQESNQRLAPADVVSDDSRGRRDLIERVSTLTEEHTYRGGVPGFKVPGSSRQSWTFYVTLSY